MVDQLVSNKEIVHDFYDLAFNKKEPEEAVKRYMGPYYRQHNPLAGDGAEPFVTFVREFAGAYPDLKIEFKRIIAEGDLVVTHGHLIRYRDDRGMAVMDIFRLEDGKVVEHWDVLQEVPETSANENTMF